MKDQLKTIREAFEATQLKRECRRLPNGDYENSFVNSAWRYFQAGVGAANDMTKGQKPVAWLCIVNTADAGPTKFFTAPSDPRGFPVFAAPPAQQPQAEAHKPLFADLIDKHPGLREELLDMDKQPQAESHLFELWWADYIPEAARSNAWGAWLAAQRSYDLGVAPQQADEVPSDVVRDADVEAAAKKMAEIFDYPWDFMPEKGRNTMRENVRAVLTAAQGEKP